MCRSTAAPLMAMAGMAGTAVGVAIAVIRERVDRRSLEREMEREILDAKAADDAASSDEEDKST